MAGYPQKTSSKKLVLIASFLFLVFVSLGLFLKAKNSSKSSFLPIDPGNSVVANASIFYTLHGKLKDNMGEEIVLEAQDKSIPNFKITPELKTYQFDGTAEREASKSSELFKKGTFVVLTVSYDYSVKAWKTLKIVALPPPQSNK